jgi:hypothetical protein
VVSIGNSSWNTSLLPYGDNTHFIALPKKIRVKEKIFLGDIIEVKFDLRERIEKK